MEDKENSETRRERIRKAIGRRTMSNARFDTSDIIQEVELQMWRDGLDHLEDKFSDVDQPLVSAIAKGHHAKMIRRHTAQKRNVNLDRPVEQDVAAGNHDPGEVMDSKEQTNLVLQSLNQLEGISYRILYRHFCLGISYNKIAEEEGLSRQQLRTKKNQALEELKALVNPPPTQSG